MKKSGVARALKQYEALVLHEYGLTLDEVLSERDADIRTKRLWRLTGVVLKQSYAKPVARRPTLGVKARYRYDINRSQLKKTLAGRSWEAKLLAELPGRKLDESLEAFVLRTKTETRHGKRVRDLLCGYVCPNGELQHLLEKAGLDPAKVGAVIVAIPKLLPALEAAAKITPPFLLKDTLMAVAVIAALGVEGVRALCDKWNKATNPILNES